MNTIGIVCEYNPFHKGHAYQIAESRRLLGEDAVIICVMSGDFVQRGENAVFSKFARAEAACRCGADIVLELPLPWSLASAESFARASVYMLNAMGCSHLSFGSEAGEIDKLQVLADFLSTGDAVEEIKQRMEKEPELSFAAARQRILEEQLGEVAELLEKPNNILAVEYLKAIRTLLLEMQCITVKRAGSAHDQTEGQGELRSASELRERLRAGEDVSCFIPEPAMGVYRIEIAKGRGALDKERFELALLSRLRFLEEEKFEQLPDGSDGAGRRLCKAAKEAGTLEELLHSAKTKRLALARIRRMCVCAALGINGDMSKDLPGYARLLAANSKGRAYLRSMEDKTTIPVLTKPANVKYIGDKETQMFALGASAHDFFCLLYPSASARKGGQDWRIGPKIV